MKEKIYTIPVNEAFDQNCECALCYLRKKLESEAVDYSLGAAMMEPDYRIISNEKGYCNKHYSMMLPKKEKLSLALVLDTHLGEIREKLADAREFIDAQKKQKKTIFKKQSESISNVTDIVSKIHKACVICDKLNSTMERYISVVFYLWDKDEAFREKLKNSKGFCLPHFNEIIAGAGKYLSGKKSIEFAETVYNKETEELERIQNDVHKFTLKFDYRNRDAKWGEEIDAPKRAVEKLSGYIIGGE